MSKLYSKKLTESKYLFYPKNKNDSILIQKLLFELGYRWINQYNSKQQVIVDFSSEQGFIIHTQGKQIYSKYGFIITKNYYEYNIISASEMIDILHYETEYLKNEKPYLFLKNRYILHSF